MANTGPGYLQQRGDSGALPTARAWAALGALLLQLPHALLDQRVGGGGGYGLDAGVGCDGRVQQVAVDVHGQHLELLLCEGGGWWGWWWWGGSSVRRCV